MLPAEGQQRQLDDQEEGAAGEGGGGPPLSPAERRKLAAAVRDFLAQHGFKLSALTLAEVSALAGCPPPCVAGAAVSRGGFLGAAWLQASALTLAEVGRALEGWCCVCLCVDAGLDGGFHC